MPFPPTLLFCGLWYKKTAAVLVAVFGVVGNAFGQARLVEDEEEEFSH